jgi:hypothetical protein
MLSLAIMRLLGFINILFGKFKEEMKEKIWDRIMDKVVNKNLKMLDKDNSKIQIMNRNYKNNKIKNKTYMIVKFITPICKIKINLQIKVI